MTCKRFLSERSFFVKKVMWLFTCKFKIDDKFLYIYIDTKCLKKGNFVFCWSFHLEYSNLYDLEWNSFYLKRKQQQQKLYPRMRQ